MQAALRQGLPWMGSSGDQATSWHVTGLCHGGAWVALAIELLAYMLLAHMTKRLPDVPGRPGVAMGFLRVIHATRQPRSLCVAVLRPDMS